LLVPPPALPPPPPDVPVLAFFVGGAPLSPFSFAFAPPPSSSSPPSLEALAIF
jgi:hypothetical protein